MIKRLFNNEGTMTDAIAWTITIMTVVGVLLYFFAPAQHI
jgi:hypothetical protein